MFSFIFVAFCYCGLTETATRTFLGVRQNLLDDLTLLQEDCDLIIEMPRIGTRTKCAMKCGEVSECVAFSYKIDSELCKMYNTTLLSQMLTSSVAGWHHYILGRTACPVHLGFYHYGVNDMCIHISSTKVADYNAGISYCNDLGSTPVTLNSTEKVNALGSVLNQLDNLPPYFYIGLTKHTDGVWRWHNGQTATIINWHGTQPYCPSHPCNCVSTVADWNWKWNDASCNRNIYNIICEI